MRVQLIRPRTGVEGGAVALLIAFLTLVFATCLAFVTDFGLAYVAKRDLQKGVDAAALAVGNDVALTAPMSADCPTMAAQVNADRATAEKLFRENVPNGAANLAAGTAGFQATCEWTGALHILVITARAAQDSPAFFGGVTGVDQLSLGKASRVVVGPVGKILGLRPFGMCKGVADLATTYPSQAITMDLSNADSGCGTAPGNFGPLDLRNINGDPGTDLVGDWTEYDYPHPIPTSPLPYTFEPSTGSIATNFEEEMIATLGDTIVLPVYDLRSGNGNTALYRIVDFAAIQVCAIKAGLTAFHDPCWNPATVPTESNARYLQFKFVRYVPVGEISVTCPLGAACDTGLRVAKLAD